jgi:hypothetical protein
MASVSAIRDLTFGRLDRFKVAEPSVVCAVRHAAGLFEGTREPGSARYPSRMCIARFSAVARIDS